MATEKQITERWGATHEISKQRLVGEIDLSYLNKNESVAMGDGKTFYWLLTEKDVVKNNLVQADVIKSVCGDCWGSGWETQFVQPCRKCNGTGKC